MGTCRASSCQGPARSWRTNRGRGSCGAGLALGVRQPNPPSSLVEKGRFGADLPTDENHIREPEPNNIR